MRRLILALLLTPAAASAAGPHYFTVVLNDAYNFDGGPEQMAGSYTVLEKMVQLANAQNVRLTLLFSAQYADYISTDSARAVALAKWRVAGHETGAWHQGPDTGGWDGYAGLTAEELKKLRGEGPAALGGPAEFFAALKRLDPDMKTACLAGSADKVFAAAGPDYEACARPLTAGRDGVNEAYLPPQAGGGDKKRLSASTPSDRGGVEEAKKNFSRMKTGVYGAAFKSDPSEFGAFYVWLAYLKDQDPDGARSRTVSEAAGQGLINKPAPGTAGKKRKPEKAAPRPARDGAGTSMPKLKPVDSPYSQANKLFPSRGRLGGGRSSASACGDGICMPEERLPGRRCLPDCGVKDK